MKVQFDAVQQSATFLFGDGLEPVVVDAAKMHDNIRAHAMMLGLTNTIRDAAALERKGPDGKVLTVTEAMRREAVLDRANYLMSGAESWTSRTGRAAPQNAAILALATRLGKSYAETEAMLAGDAIAEMIAGKGA